MLQRIIRNYKCNFDHLIQSGFISWRKGQVARNNYVLPLHSFLRNGVTTNTNILKTLVVIIYSILFFKRCLEALGSCLGGINWWEKQNKDQRHIWDIAINKLSIDTRIKLNKYSLLLFIDKGNVPKKKTMDKRPLIFDQYHSPLFSHSPFPIDKSLLNVKRHIVWARGGLNGLSN